MLQRPVEPAALYGKSHAFRQTASMVNRGICSGQTSITPCATAQGAFDTMPMAYEMSAASIIAKPAIGKADDMNGPLATSTFVASGLRT